MKVIVLTAMYPTQERPVFGTFVQEQVESLRKAGVEVDVMFFDGQHSLRNYVRAGVELRRRLDSEHYDLVHGHYGLVALPALMQRKCPVVITYHGSDLLGEIGPNGGYTFAGKLKVLLCKAMGHFVDGRIIVAELLRARNWSAVMIPMGVDMELFRPRPRDEARRQLGLPLDRRLILFVANPANRRKQIGLAQAAIDLVAANDPTVELVPVFNVPHDQVPVYMNAGDLLILTSDHEASPCVVKEALASNIGVVSVDCGDVVERLRGVEGSYIAERDPVDIANKLRLALDFPGERNGRMMVEPLSMENTARQTIAVFERALASKHTN